MSCCFSRYLKSFYLDLEITPRSLSKYKTSKFISLTTNLCLITVAKKTCTIEMTQNTPLYFLFSLFHLIFKYVWKEGEIYFYRPASFNFSNVEKYFNLPDLHTLRDMKKHNIIVFCKFCITHLPHWQDNLTEVVFLALSELKTC